MISQCFSLVIDVAGISGVMEIYLLGTNGGFRSPQGHSICLTVLLSHPFYHFLFNLPLLHPPFSAPL